MLTDCRNLPRVGETASSSHGVASLGGEILWKGLISRCGLAGRLSGTWLELALFTLCSKSSSGGKKDGPLVRPGELGVGAGVLLPLSHSMIRS